jgi:2'-5' RNA ligase
MMLRTFIALEIPPEIQNAIASSTTSLRNSLPKPVVRWVAKQNLHVTLKFLGDVSPANLDQLVETLRHESARHAGFSMPVGRLGAFPSSRRARIIWIGLGTSAALDALQRGVEAAAGQLGYAREDRPFSPHLTIGRVGQGISASDNQRIRTVLDATPVDQLGTVDVQAIHIFKSDLQPGEPVYTLLHSLPLRST